MNATRNLIRDTIVNVPACPDGPVGACPSCLSYAIAESLELGAALERHPAGRGRDDQLDILQALCAHIWPPELDADAECQLCALPYSRWSE